MPDFAPDNQSTSGIEKIQLGTDQADRTTHLVTLLRLEDLEEFLCFLLCGVCHRKQWTWCVRAVPGL